MKITQKQISAEAQEINKEIENPHEGDDCICRQKPCMKELGISEKKKKEKKSSGIDVS